MKRCRSPNLAQRARVEPRATVSSGALCIHGIRSVTILITAASNIFKSDDGTSPRSLRLNYAYAAFFGLIHGMGFSNYLKSILGRDESIITQLLAFNLGLEFGQIVIVAIFLITGFILVDLFGVTVEIGSWLFPQL